MVRDPSVCDDIGCTAARTLDRVSDQLQYDYFRLDRPPFKTREFVIKEDFHQDPRTKAVFMTVRKSGLGAMHDLRLNVSRKLCANSTRLIRESRLKA